MSAPQENALGPLEIARPSPPLRDPYSAGHFSPGIAPNSFGAPSKPSASRRWPFLPVFSFLLGRSFWLGYSKRILGLASHIWNDQIG